MTTPLPPRTVDDSCVDMTEIVLPEDANSRGSVFGGRVLALVDKCAAAVALRHTRGGVVTLRLDSVEFKNPVRVGDLLLLHGQMNAVFGSSMEVEVQAFSEDPFTGEKRLTTKAFVTMVAVDGNGKSKPAPKLKSVTEDEKRRVLEATARRASRLRPKKN